MPPLQHTRKILAVKNYEDTPLIPSYSFYGTRCKSGQLHYRDGKKWKECTSSFGKKKMPKKKTFPFTEKHLQGMARKLKVTMSKNGRKKTVKKLFDDVMKKCMSVLKSKKMTPEKKYVIKHCKSMSKKLGIKHTGKTHSQLCSQIVKSCKNTNKSSFGSWWDNTQQLYGGANTKQAADASNLNGSFPFYNKDSWQPYYSINGPSFGYAQYNSLDPYFDYNSLHNHPPAVSWPTYSNLGNFPRSLDSPYPFSY